VTGVGKTLKDHIVVYFGFNFVPGYVIPGAVLDSWPGWFRNIASKPSYFGSGTGKDNIFHLFVSSLANISVPDIQLKYFAHNNSIAIALQRVNSKGSVTLDSNDPLAYPNVILNYPLVPADIDALYWGIEFVRELIKSPPFSQIIEKETFPAIYDPIALKQWITENYNGYNHHTGTCPLGETNSPDSVVDTSLRVKSVTNLRVTDASVLTHSGNGNIHTTVMATALRASDIILGKHTPQQIVS